MSLEFLVVGDPRLSLEHWFMVRKVSVVIVTPDLTLMGGVANYFNVLRAYLPSEVKYFTACRREDETIFGTMMRVVDDCRNFKNFITSCNVFHVNPSLGVKSIVREGIFIAIAKKK